MQGQRNGHASGQAFIPDLSGPLHCGTLPGWSPDVLLTGPIGIGPLEIPWVESSYTECPSSM